jgi:hypothetical protein
VEDDDDARSDQDWNVWPLLERKASLDDMALLEGMASIRVALIDLVACRD